MEVAETCLCILSVPLAFTTGRSYCVRTQRMLNQCLESLAQKVQSGVVINFEKSGPDPPPIGEGSVNALCLLQPVLLMETDVPHSLLFCSFSFLLF